MILQVIPSPPPIEILALALVMYLAGLVTPWYYAQERMRGFGRWIAKQIPYEPPPGEDAGEALQSAVEAGEESPDQEDES